MSITHFFPALRPRHSVHTVLRELIAGLQNGSIILEKDSGQNATRPLERPVVLAIYSHDQAEFDHLLQAHAITARQTLRRAGFDGSNLVEYVLGVEGSPLPPVNALLAAWVGDDRFVQVKIGDEVHEPTSPEGLAAVERSLTKG